MSLRPRHLNPIQIDCWLSSHIDSSTLMTIIAGENSPSKSPAALVQSNSSSSQARIPLKCRRAIRESGSGKTEHSSFKPRIAVLKRIISWLHWYSPIDCEQRPSCAGWPRNCCIDYWLIKSRHALDGASWNWKCEGCRWSLDEGSLSSASYV